MGCSLRTLIYSKDFPDDLKFQLLNIIDSPRWVEDLIDLIKEISDDNEDCNCPTDCDNCELDYACDYKDLKSNHNTLLDEYDELKENFDHFREMTAKIVSRLKKTNYSYYSYDDNTPADILVDLDNAIQEHYKELEDTVKNMLAEVKKELYGNNSGEYNRYSAIREKIDTVEELKLLIPEYLKEKKEEIIEEMKRKKGLVVGGIELPYVELK